MVLPRIGMPVAVRIVTMVGHDDKQGIVKPGFFPRFFKIVAQAVVGIIGGVDILVFIIAPVQRLAKGLIPGGMCAQGEKRREKGLFHPADIPLHISKRVSVMYPQLALRHGAGKVGPLHNLVETIEDYVTLDIAVNQLPAEIKGSTVAGFYQILDDTGQLDEFVGLYRDGTDRVCGKPAEDRGHPLLRPGARGIDLVKKDPVFLQFPEFGGDARFTAKVLNKVGRPALEDEQNNVRPFGFQDTGR